MSLYLNHLLPAVTAAGDDGNYGSCAMYDVLALQACSPFCRHALCCSGTMLQADIAVLRSSEHLN